MVEFAKKNQLDVVCANAASRYTNLVGRKGQKALMALPEDSKKYFAPLPYDTATGKYYDKLMGLSNHEPAKATKDTSKKAPSKMPSMGSYNLILGQSLWDATMAKSIERAISNNKKDGLVMHICGRFHSDEYLGTVAQLQRRNKDRKILTISCFPAEDFTKPNYEAYENLADFVVMVKKNGE
jgi:uncharacterized iron-regulated protein